MCFERKYVFKKVVAVVGLRLGKFTVCCFSRKMFLIQQKKNKTKIAR